MTRWIQFRKEAPELAEKVESSFESNIHHVIGTIRKNGSPRLSGTEVRIDDEVRIGIMPDAVRLQDIDHDPRVEIHSAPLEPDLAHGDARLSGRLEHSGGCEFTLDVTRVTLVRVVDHQLLHQVWRPGLGIQESRRR